MPPDSVPPLRRIYLYLSGSCNLSCRHCWIDPGPPGGGRAHLPLAALQRIIGSARNLGLSSVKLTGGEPFVHPHAPALIEWLGRNGLGVVVETNGTLIGPAEARLLRQAQAEAALSLDGPSAEVHEALRGTAGCFAAALRGAEALRAAGVRFQVVACLYRANRPYLARMPRMVKELGGSSLKVNPVVGVSRAAVMRDRGELLSVAEVLETREEIARAAAAERVRLQFDVPPAFEPIAALRSSPLQTCGILNILGVLADGHASMCGIGRLVPKLDMGDLTALDVRQVWREAPLLLRIRANVPGRLGGICGRCVLRRYCLGKCLAHDYLESGKMFSGHAFCRQAYEAGLFPASRLVPETCAEAAGS